MDSTKKKILNNATFLYIRIFITTLISLYVTRVLLKNLGISDFGIYNVIAGTITIFAFIGNAMVSSTQRYLSYSMVADSKEQSNNIFNACIRIHLILSIIITILGETIGIYLINNILNIPSERFSSAVIVFHCVVLIFSINVLTIPINALINAKEDMHFIALSNILESFGKLIIAYSISLIFIDKLQFYGFSLLTLAILISMLSILYCFNKYKEYRIHLRKIKISTYKELSLFSIWTLWGSMTSLIKGQGTTVLLNIFHGPLANAAYGLASQIGNNINTFSSTLLKAVNPQIVKSYGRENLYEMYFYVMISCRFSFFLFVYLFIPIFIEMDFILTLWLKSIPEYTLIFSKIVLINAMIDILIGPLITAIQATGKIKHYQITSGLFFLLNVPIMFFLLKAGYSPETTLISTCIFTGFQGIIRLYYLQKLIDFPVYMWLREVFFRSLMVLVLSLLLVYPIYILLHEGWLRLTLILLAELVICSFFFFAIGINKKERDKLKIIITDLIQRYGINKK